MTASTSNPLQRFFFVHIMKTGGNALVHRLRNHFGAAVYPTGGLDGTDMWDLYLLPDRLQEQLTARGDQIRLVAGHFPLCISELMDGRFTTLTLLREPVERTLSYLRSAPTDSLEDAHEQARGPTHMKLGWHPAYDLENNMTRMFSLTPDEWRASGRVELNRGHLERAKEALAGMDAVGVQEHLEDFCEELSARFGWHLGEPVRANPTVPVEVSESFRARIAEDNAFDIELYEFAQGLLATSTTSL